MQNASWEALKQTRPCSRSPVVHHRDPRHPLRSRRSPARATPGRRARRAACRRARAARSARRPRPARRPGVSVPRKRSPSVTSSSFLRGLTKTSRASASGVAGPTVSAPRIITSLTVGPASSTGMWTVSVMRSPKCGARFSRNAATPSRPVGLAGEAGDRARLLGELLVEVARPGLAQQPLDAAVRGRSGRPRAARASASRLGVERVVGHDPVDEPELARRLAAPAAR